jgi:hypothetical protein
MSEHLSAREYYDQAEQRQGKIEVHQDYLSIFDTRGVKYDIGKEEIDTPEKLLGWIVFFEPCINVTKEFLGLLAYEIPHIMGWKIEEFHH